MALVRNGASGNWGYQALDSSKYVKVGLDWGLVKCLRWGLGGRGMEALDGRIQGGSFSLF